MITQLNEQHDSSTGQLIYGLEISEDIATALDCNDTSSLEVTESDGSGDPLPDPIHDRDDSGQLVTGNVHIQASSTIMWLEEYS